MRRAKAWYAAAVALRERLLDTPTGAMPAPRPDELLLCAFSLVGGVPTLLGQPPISVSDVVLWRPLLYAWAVSLVIWPAVIIWSSLARWRGTDQVSAAIVHRRASLLLAGTCGAYIVAVLSYNHLVGVPAASFVLGFAVMRLWRAYEMRRWLAGQPKQPL